MKLESSLKLKTGGVDLKTILNKIPKISTFPLSVFADMTWHHDEGGWVSQELLNFSRKIYLSGPQQVPWGLIRPSTPKSLPTPTLEGHFSFYCCCKVILITVCGVWNCDVGKPKNHGCCHYLSDRILVLCFQSRLEDIGVGAQPTSEVARHFLPEIYEWKINKMPKFYVIFAP